MRKNMIICGFAKKGYNLLQTVISFDPENWEKISKFIFLSKNIWQKIVLQELYLLKHILKKLRFWPNVSILAQIFQFWHKFFNFGRKFHFNFCTHFSIFDDDVTFERNVDNTFYEKFWRRKRLAKFCGQKSKNSEENWNYLLKTKTKIFRW